MVSNQNSTECFWWFMFIKSWITSFRDLSSNVTQFNMTVPILKMAFCTLLSSKVTTVIQQELASLNGADGELLTGCQL